MRSANLRRCISLDKRIDKYEKWIKKVQGFIKKDKKEIKQRIRKLSVGDNVQFGIDRGYTEK